MKVCVMRVSHSIDVQPTPEYRQVCDDDLMEPIAGIPFRQLQVVIVELHPQDSDKGPNRRSGRMSIHLNVQSDSQRDRRHRHDAPEIAPNSIHR